MPKLFREPTCRSKLPVPDVTSSSLVHIEPTIGRRHENNDAVDILFLHFAKAFDKDKHALLLLKMESHGIVPEIIRWTKAFWTDRTFGVCVNGRLASPTPAPSCVPQGSAIDPLLLLIYINDLADLLGENCLLYADDAKLIFHRRQSTFMQNAVNITCEWSQKCKLPLNVAKCAHLPIKESESVPLSYTFPYQNTFDPPKIQKS